MAGSLLCCFFSISALLPLASYFLVLPDYFSGQFSNQTIKTSFTIYLDISFFLFVWNFLNIFTLNECTCDSLLPGLPQMYFFVVSFSLSSAKAFYNSVCRARMVKYGMWSVAVQRNQETLNLGFVWNCLLQLHVMDSGLEKGSTRILQPMSWVLSLPLHSKCVHWHILQACCRGTEQLCVHGQYVCLFWVCMEGFPYMCVWLWPLHMFPSAWDPESV